MGIEFIGYIASSPSDSVFDFPYLRDMTRLHERAGFDTVLVGYGPDSPDPLQIAAYAAAHSEQVRMLVAHRAGVVFPTLAARMIATLDQVTGGRVSLNLVPGGTSDADPRREGDYLPKERRYARTAEYLQVLKLAWTAAGPISHAGEYYRFEDYPPRVRPLQQPWVPLFLAGSSLAGRIVAGQHADRYAFYGEPLSGTAELISSVRRAAAEAGRAEPPGFVARFRVILADTDDTAWDRARRHVESLGPAVDGGAVTSEGNRRLRAASVAGERHDHALWTVPVGQWGTILNALVGSPATVAQALLDYVDLGVTGFRISGLLEPEDTEIIGAELIPLVRAGARAVAAPHRTGAP